MNKSIIFLIGLLSIIAYTIINYRFTGDELDLFCKQYPTMVWFFILFVVCQTILILSLIVNLKLKMNYKILTYTTLIIIFYWISDSIWSLTSYDSNLHFLQEHFNKTIFSILLLKVPPYQVGSRIITTVSFLVIGILISRYFYKLRDSEDRYSHLFKNMLNAVAYHKVIVDENGEPIDYEYLNVNDAFEVHTGVKPKDIIGKRVTEVFDMADIDPEYGNIIKNFGYVGINQTTEQKEIYFPDLQKWFSVSLYSPKKFYFIAIFSDISERKKYDISVRALIQQSSSFGQEYFSQMTKTMSDVLKCDYIIIGKLNDVGDKVTTIAARGHGKEMVNFEYPLKNTPCEFLLQGNTCVYEDNVSSMFSKDSSLVRRQIRGYIGVPLIVNDKIIGVMAALFKSPLKTKSFRQDLMQVFSNRTAAELQRIKVQDKNEKLNQKIRHIQKMEAIGTLSGGLAHDFNNILTCILGNVELVKLRAGKQCKYWDNIINIEKSVYDGSNLTKQLLGFARGGKYLTQALDMNKLVTEVLGTIERTAKQIKFETELNEIPFISGDKNQMKRILLNLILNSMDSIEDSGVIKFETSLRNFTPDDVLKYEFAIKPGYYICLSITDDGCGMSEEVKEKAFEPFFTTKEMGLGTGLGLATVFGIIKNHGGMISIYSEQGYGTTISFCIPKSDNQKIDYNKKIAKKEVFTGTGTILIVDDEKAILDIARQFLIRLGYNPIVTDNGKEAIEIYQDIHEEIDLVILDLIMPAIGGVKVLEEIKKVNPDVKVLLSSGYSKNGYADKAMKMGCADFVQKPYTLSELSEKIDMCLNNTC